MRENSIRTSSLDMLILKILSENDCYGYQISQLLRDYSNAVLQIAEAAMYPALYRMQEKGYITDYKVKVGKRRSRVYYHIEEEGETALSALIAEYQLITKATTMAVLEHEVDQTQDNCL